MFLEKKILQGYKNKKGNLSFEQLVQYFSMYTPPSQSGLITASDFADECMRVTEGASEDIAGDADPFLIPKTERTFDDSTDDVDSRILICK